MAAPRQLYVNLAVENLSRSVDFFTKLGFSFDPQFTDDKATCMIIGNDAFAMLLERDRFQDFTKKAICDTSTSVEVLLALSCESRNEVDEMVRTAVAEGGSPAGDSQDLGFMYSSSFQDPDGHVWEVLWMDPNAQPS
jgi:uncharacterized protein